MSLHAWLHRVWGQRGPWAWALRPVAALYRLAAQWQRSRYASGQRAIERPPVPVLVIGNWIVGGAGKTPTLIAVLDRLKAWGWQAGVVSRGYGRRSQGVVVANPQATAEDLGDEPLLLARRGRVPLAVGADRGAAARALLAAHPGLDLLISDDGLQHAGLARDLAVLVFDRRGVGNGWLLPAGPLRQDREWPPLPGSRADTLVLYSDGQVSTPRAGFLAQRQLRGAVPLPQWWADPESPAQALSTLRDRPLWAAAGLAQPQGFFDLLTRAGLHFTALPLPDHHDYVTLPWPRGSEVVLTEKDAAKLPPERLHPGDRVWVLPLDLCPEPAFDAALLHALQQMLGPAPHGPTPDRTPGLPPVQGAAATQP